MLYARRPAPAARFAVIALCALAASKEAYPAQTPHVSMTGRSIQAIRYWVGTGSTTIDLNGTGLIPGTEGYARVDARPGLTTVQAETQGLMPALQLGAEFLTYVLWAVSPEGRAINLGAVLPDSKERGRLRATTRLQTFSLFVTAEPYAAVRQPGETVILENSIRRNTKGRVAVVNDYQLVKRTQYKTPGNPPALSMDLKNVPLEIY